MAKINLTRPPRLLFVHSGSNKKRRTFETAAALGIEIYLLNPQPNWATDFARECIFTEGHSLREIIALAADLHRRVGLDGVVTFWEEDVPTCALIGARLGLPANSMGAALNARSKFLMRRALARAGVPVPSFRLVDSPASLLRACAAIGTPAILKPEWGSDSEWVVRVCSPEHALAVYRDVSDQVRVQDCIYPYETGTFVFEGLLSGPEVSIEGVVEDGRITLYAIIDKAEMDEGTFIERGETTPSRQPAEIQEAIRAMVCSGIKALGLRHGGIHAEVKVTPDGPRIVEIGARMGGDCIHPLVERVYGIDLIEENIRVALGQPARPASRAAGCAISRTLVPEQPGRVSYRVSPKPRRSRSLIEVVLTKEHGDRVAVPPEGYDNLAWISVWGRTYLEAERRLQAQVTRLENALCVQPDEYPDLAAEMQGNVSILQLR